MVWSLAAIRLEGEGQVHPDNHNYSELPAMVDSNNRSSIMMFWFLFLVLCDTGHGRPRGSDPPFLDDKKPRRDLRGRLNGGRVRSCCLLVLFITSPYL